MKNIDRIVSSNGNVLMYSNKHMKVHSDVLEHLEKAFNLFNPTEESFQKVLIDLGEKVGFTTCVTVTDSDTIVYKTRHGRKWPSKMVLDREPVPCSTICLVIRRTRYNNVFRLLTAYFGIKSAREEHDFNVTDPDELLFVKEFWSNHALLYED